MNTSVVSLCRRTASSGRKHILVPKLDKPVARNGIIDRPSRNFPTFFPSAKFPRQACAGRTSKQKVLVLKQLELDTLPTICHSRNTPYCDGFQSMPINEPQSQSHVKRPPAVPHIHHLQSVPTHPVLVVAQYHEDVLDGRRNIALIAYINRERERGMECESSKPLGIARCRTLHNFALSILARDPASEMAGDS